jgi:hypothetical protein
VSIVIGTAEPSTRQEAVRVGGGGPTVKANRRVWVVPELEAESTKVYVDVAVVLRVCRLIEKLAPLLVTAT